jgi:pyridinium-3,5-biscarboxylic acid mononucleotide sulfurtransferase
VKIVIDETLKQRIAALDAILAEMGSILVAFSGGVDSALLAVRAHQVLGSSALAVTADSPSLADLQRQNARDLAARFAFEHLIIPTFELDDPAYRRNDANRCYHCKAELFGRLRPLAEKRGLAHVGYGLIVDDLTDYRPGRRAADEAGARAPLAEAGLSKADVRVLSRELGLPTWDQPASPCLSSRIPYGTAVTAGSLRQIEAAEAALRALGFRELRVRHLGETARVELAAAELPRLEDAAEESAVVSAVRSAGYRAVVIDREGYRPGRLNEALRLV